MTATINADTISTGTITTDAITTAWVRRNDGARRARVHRAPAGRPVLVRRTATVYRRRRMLVGVLSAVAVACGAVVTHDVLAGSGGVPASAAASQPAHVRSAITAQPGDTLWSIARTHRGDVPIGRYVDKLVSLNAGASIRAGQQIVLP